jgi:hypothetical protein
LLKSPKPAARTLPRATIYKISFEQPLNLIDRIYNKPPELLTMILA